MVKVTNVFGDVKRGRQGTAVYQGFYGRQVRRLWTKEKKNRADKQLEVQGRFREGVVFAASLSKDEIDFLKSYVVSRGLCLTWHSFAKLIAMERPLIDISSIVVQRSSEVSYSGSLVVEHPAIRSIDLFDRDVANIFSISGLTDLSEGVITAREVVPVNTSRALSFARVETAAGKFYYALLFDPPVKFFTTMVDVTPLPTFSEEHVAGSQLPDLPLLPMKAELSSFKSDFTVDISPDARMDSEYLAGSQLPGLPLAQMKAELSSFKSDLYIGQASAVVSL